MINVNENKKDVIVKIRTSNPQNYIIKPNKIIYLRKG